MDTTSLRATNPLGARRAHTIAALALTAVVVAAGVGPARADVPVLGSPHPRQP